MAKHYNKDNFRSVVHEISFHPDRRVGVFLRLPAEERAAVLMRLTRHIQYDLLRRLKEPDLVAVLEHLDPDEATDVVQVLPKRRQKAVVDKLSANLRQAIETLTQFDPRTAAGLMNIDYILAEEDSTIADAAKRFKAHEKRTGRSPAIIAVRRGRLIGYVPGHELGFALPAEPIARYVRRISTVRFNTDHDEVLRLFRDHPHNKVVVVGESGNVLGIIYSDDILRLLEEQESASLYDFAGVHDEETVTDTVAAKVRSRYKWLIINLGTAFLAAFTVSFFEETIAKYVLLAVYMPIVAGMGGNAGTQTLAILVRGIALNQIDLKTGWTALRREAAAGLLNGLINGAIVAAIVIFFNRDYKVAAVLASAMVINLLVAGTFGTLVPLIMKRLGKDPATSATIFITTATDVLGFLVFLGLAAAVLE